MTEHKTIKAEDVTCESSSSSQYFQNFNSKTYHFYLSGDIKSPDNYIEWFQIISSASEQDHIFLHINSYGGDMSTAIQFLKVMSETKASIITSVEGMCFSAATLLFLAGTEMHICDHSMFMFHNYSGGTYGKGGEMFEQVIHGRKWSEHLFKETYKDFLTDDEINGIIDNKDIWMTAEEVTNRLSKKYQKIRKDVISQLKGEKKKNAKKAKFVKS